MKNLFRKLKQFYIQNKVMAIVLTFALAAFLVVLSLAIAYKPGTKLTGLEIESPPIKTQYIEKEVLNPEGLVVKAHYGKKSVAVTDYSIDKEILHTEDKQVTVSFTDNGITQSASFEITVLKKSLASIEVVSDPIQLSYIEDSYFKTDGMQVEAVYDNGERETVSDWDYDKKAPLGLNDKFIAIQYGGKTVAIEISVIPKQLKLITANCLPNKVDYVEGEYFDFLGMKIYADYENAPAELVKSWDYDKKDPLSLSDTGVLISYSRNGITKSVSIPITVKQKQKESPELELMKKAISVLPSVNNLSEENLPAIDYVLKLLNNNASNLTSEQAEFKVRLENKRLELSEFLPPESEPEYSITYSIANHLCFEDIDYGRNPLKYKNSEGAIELTDATSTVATEQGYQFQGWLLDGIPVTSITNLSSDITVYATFNLTPNVDIVLKDYETDAELFVLRGIPRTENFDFQENRIAQSIYSLSGMLPVAFYNEDRVRIVSGDLSFGKTIIFYVVRANARELHLSGGGNATVGWNYRFTVNEVEEHTVESQDIGTVFTVPVGATVTIISTNANIGDILVDGVKKGEKINNTLVQAVFELTAGEYPASITFETVLSGTVMLSFVGYNSHSITYPSGWNGYIAQSDLNTIAFIYDESSTNYLTTYTIDGTIYYFEDLAGYLFENDTQIMVKRIRNRFTLQVFYQGGNEKFEGLVGKQTVLSALNGISAEALETLNTIFTDGRLYSDTERNCAITKDAILLKVLRGDIVVYSEWERPIPPPEEPIYEAVDYGSCDFVDTWNAIFLYGGDVLASEFVLTADGFYTYQTSINGTVCVSAYGIYRMENYSLVIKTLLSEEGNGLVTAQDIAIDIAFVQDGLLSVSFVDLRGSEKTVFDHTLTCGNVRVVNYTEKDFIGKYEIEGITIELRENGTAVVIQGGCTESVYYREKQNGSLFIFGNGIVGAGEVVGIFGRGEE